MISELVVDVQPKEVSIAVLEDKSLVELQKEARNVSFAVGDIYLGKVKKLMPGLNAAFIDVGYKKDAFLHYLDLGPNFNTQQKYLKQLLSDPKKAPVLSKTQILPEIEKNGSISDGRTEKTETFDRKYQTEEFQCYRTDILGGQACRRA